VKKNENLVDQTKPNSFIVAGQGFTSDLLKHIKSSDVHIMTVKELENSNVSFSSKDKLYVPSETALPDVLENTKDKNLRTTVEAFKDKAKCRQLISSLFPNFYFKTCKLADLPKFHIEPGKKYVVKPVKGFFATAVKVIDDKANLAEITQEMLNELQKFGTYFSKDILFAEDVLIEEFIEGEEYAVDVFYSSNGTPVITNITHHPINPNSPYLQMLYYSSKEIFEELYQPMIDFFTKLGKKIDIRSFAIHAEFRYHNNKLTPIEFNPLRFGGFGLADLTYHAYGINPFEIFFNDKTIDWKKVWEEKGDACYAWVLGNNGVNLDLQKWQPDHEAFKKLFSNLLYYNKLAYQENPAFAIAYIKEENKEKLFKLLDIEFRDLFVETQVR
jgi:hypothetical protein